MNKFAVFGIKITNTNIPDAIELIKKLIEKKRETHSIFFVNTHTMNLALAEKTYKDILNSANFVFGDGTGVRWASKILERVCIRGNVNGTDLIPALLRSTAGKNYRCFLLGSTAEEIARAATYFKTHFNGWVLAGYHHGFIHKNPDQNEQVIKKINRSQPDLLLVGMGNPLQEKWIHYNKDKLKVSIAVGIGGLFSYWAGSIDRAPVWMRRYGVEWIHIMRSQPRKWKRYCIGNVKFLMRIAYERIL